MASLLSSLIPIHHCHLVMINVHPNGQLCEVRGHPAREVILQVEIKCLTHVFYTI
jgi:Cell cycle and development regulator